MFTYLTEEANCPPALTQLFSAKEYSAHWGTCGCICRHHLFLQPGDATGI